MATIDPSQSTATTASANSSSIHPTRHRIESVSSSRLLPIASIAHSGLEQWAGHVNDIICLNSLNQTLIPLTRVNPERKRAPGTSIKFLSNKNNKNQKKKPSNLLELFGSHRPEAVSAGRRQEMALAWPPPPSRQNTSGRGRGRPTNQSKGVMKRRHRHQRQN